MTQNDMKILESASKLSWEEVNEEQWGEKLSCDEARKALHQMLVTKYHYDEWKSDMI